VANGAEGYERALNEKNAIVARMAQMLTDVRDALARCSRNKDSSQKIVRLMQMSEFGINPTKPWKEQSEKLRTSPNARNLERLSTRRTTSTGRCSAAATRTSTRTCAA
jgi:hypothetical protein